MAIPSYGLLHRCHQEYLQVAISTCRLHTPHCFAACLKDCRAATDQTRLFPTSAAKFCSLAAPRRQANFVYASSAASQQLQRRTQTFGWVISLSSWLSLQFNFDLNRCLLKRVTSKCTATPKYQIDEASAARTASILFLFTPRSLSPIRDAERTCITWATGSYQNSTSSTNFISGVVYCA